MQQEALPSTGQEMKQYLLLSHANLPNVVKNMISII